MNQGPVSCLPMNNKMSKVKKALDEAHETRARELDLVDKNVASFDEMPGLCKSRLFLLLRMNEKNAKYVHIWMKKRNSDVV